MSLPHSGYYKVSLKFLLQLFLSKCYLYKIQVLKLEWENWICHFFVWENCARAFIGPLKMVSLNNTCTVHFICQRFNLWSFLWLCLNAILLFISDKNFSAMSLEFLDFRVLIMNILCLFQCPCLTRTALAFKSPLSELSGKWCSHAMGLSCIFSIFSSYAEIKFMLSLWQVGVLQHNLGFWWCLLLHTELAGQKEMKNALSSVWHWVLWPGRHSSSRGWSMGPSLSFLCLYARAVPLLQLQGISQQVSHKPRVPAKRVCFLESAFSNWEEEILISSACYKWTDWQSLGEGIHPSHPAQCGPEKYPVTRSSTEISPYLSVEKSWHF